jgi:hypothetical protein
VCVTRSLLTHKKQCPSCRAPCFIDGKTAAENVIIKSMCLSLDSDSYLSRLEENKNEVETLSSLLPVFFYNTVLFPGSHLGLHLFEPRYRLMMQRIKDLNPRQFAFVPVVSGQPVPGDVALVARLTDLEFLHDGRCMLEARMHSRFKLRELFVEPGTQGLSYCKMSEELVDDPVDVTTRTFRCCSEAARIMCSRYQDSPRLTFVFGPMPIPTGTYAHASGTRSSSSSTTPLHTCASLSAVSLWLTAVLLNENHWGSLSNPPRERIPFVQSELLTSTNALNRIMRLYTIFKGPEQWDVDFGDDKDEFQAFAGGGEGGEGERVVMVARGVGDDDDGYGGDSGDDDGEHQRTLYSRLPPVSQFLPRRDLGLDSDNDDDEEEDEELFGLDSDNDDDEEEDEEGEDEGSGVEMD